MKNERRRIWKCLIFAVLFATLAIISVGSVSAATTHYVNPGDSIQTAVTAADPGDTVVVRDGTYTENVEVNVANLTLRSENGSASTTVVAAVNTSDVFLVTANSVTISGFTVSNATSMSGIHLDSVHHCTVSDNNASGNYHGIDLYSSSNNNLTSNTASNNEYGITMDYLSNNNTLMDNTASNNSWGIYLYSSNNTLTSNTANSNNYDGVRLDSSSNNNTLTDNTANSNNWDGIRLKSSSNNNTLTTNTASNNYRGIDLSSSSYSNNLIGNTVSNNSYGIELYYSSNNTLTGNTASNNSYDGILVGYSNNNTLTGNTASNNSNVGIYLDSSSNNTLTGNIALNNLNGIYLEYSCNNNSLVSNIANSNTHSGIYLRSSCNNTALTGNTASNNTDYGIYLYYYSSNNTLTGNTASNNTNYGIRLESASNNNIIYNNYFDNTNNAYDDGNNIWNITQTWGTNIIGGLWLGGNYWNDYTGNDTNGDGLGDTQLPYNSSGGIQNGGDGLPLVKAEEPIFDTGEGSYPSISGTFTGTIVPSRNLTVSTLYTYSCKGTGGHTKSIELYEDQTLIASGVWSGYQGDWHNVTLNSEVTLLKDHEYRYFIETGSYPQIVHAESKDVTGGTISCEEFVDVNGKRHGDWIPAIQLD